VIIDGAAGGETKIRHAVTFLLLTLHRGKDRVHFSTGFFPKENIVSLYRCFSPTHIANPYPKGFSRREKPLKVF
jgi:hypothetical protein